MSIVIFLDGAFRGRLRRLTGADGVDGGVAIRGGLEVLGLGGGAGA